MQEPSSHTPDSSAPLRVRVRSRQACEPCRKRKRKCNGTMPCQECIGYGYECNFQKTPSKAAKYGEKLQSARDFSHRLSLSGHSPESHKPNASSLVRESEAEMNGSPAPVSQLQTPNGGITDVPSKARPVLEPYKSRFVSAHSMIAFPRSIGIDLRMPHPPRLHSYAWNLGIRSEHPVALPTKICGLLTLDQAMPFFEAYFDHINPLYTVLTRDKFMQRTFSYWIAPGQGIEFESVICGVIGLGSLFSGAISSPVEWEIVDHARVLLDASFSQAPALVSLDHVVAWVLRSLYLRMTTRPHISWIATINSMHLAESIGLHQEMTTVSFAVDSVPQNLGVEERESRRRIFWVALSLNRLLAAEYGRSRAYIDNIRCRKPEDRGDGHYTDLIELADLLNSSAMPDNEVALGSEIGATLDRLAQIHCDHPASILLRAEVCLILCSRLRLTNRKYTTEEIASICMIIKEALAECRSFARQRQPWWSVLCFPFHSVCLLLSINTHESMGGLTEAMETLVDVSLIYDTHLAREAVRTARQLIGQAAQRKRHELIPLEELSHENDEPTAMPSSESSDLLNNNIFEGLLEDDLGWTQFFGNELLG